MSDRKIFVSAEITPTVAMWLNENEMRALIRIASYGPGWIKKHIDFTKQEFEGIESLWSAIRNDLPNVIANTQKARNVFIGGKG